MSPFFSRISTILMRFAVGGFSSIVPLVARMVFRRRKVEGLRAIEATIFRVERLFAWHPSRTVAATECDGCWAGFKNLFRIPVTSFKRGVQLEFDSATRSCSRGPCAIIGSWLRRRGRPAPHAAAEGGHMDHGIVGGIKLDPLVVRERQVIGAP